VPADSQNEEVDLSVVCAINMLLLMHLQLLMLVITAMFF